MGQNHSHNEQFKHHLKKFDEDELAVLKEIFKDLASRSNGTTIDKNTFLQYFPLPGLWGERLFKKFDTKGTDEVDFESFITGIAICCRGTPDEKIHFLFDMYDLAGDGYIQKNELITMLYNFPAALNFVRFEGKVLSVKGIGESGDAGPDQIKVEELADKIIEECDLHKHGKLSYAEFKKWLEQNPQILEAFSSAFHEDVWSLEGKALHNNDAHMPRRESTIPRIASTPSMSPKTGQVSRQSSDPGGESQGPRYPMKLKEVFARRRTMAGYCPQCNTQMQLCSNCGGSLNAENRCLNCEEGKEPALSAGTCPSCGGPLEDKGAPLSSEWEMEGHLYKVGRRSHQWKVRWYVLKDNLLYYYRNADDSRPLGVLFLEGCYIDAVDDPHKQHKFGFQISHEHDKYRKHVFFAVDELERDRWVEALRRAAKVRNLYDFYTIHEMIGEGKFSHVHRAVNKITGEEVAVKIIDKSKLNAQEKELLRSEIAIMRLLNHPHVIHLKEIFDTKSTLYIIMELVRGGELFDRIVKKKQLPELEASQIIEQLLRTVQYLHDCGIIHRDLKPENILLNTDAGAPEIKITDFGLSKLVLPSEQLTMPCGTLAYVAPEVLTLDGYDKTADVWSIGVIMYLLLRGRLPFDSKDKKLIVERTLQGRLDFNDDKWKLISSAAKDLVTKLLKTDPHRRYTIEEALNHEWIKNPEAVIAADRERVNGVAA